VLRELSEKRTALRQTLQDMLQRNQGQIEEIVGE
jgi:lambda repressor-like predicted transcriptional regulator